MDCCVVGMSDHKPCGRRLYAKTAVASPESTCLMHYPGAKPTEDFQAEVDLLIAGKSQRNTLGLVDFRGFHFPSGVCFVGKVFSDYACFIGAVFSGAAEFPHARFVKDANFAKATFLGTDFSAATFEESGVFAAATFGQQADFRRSVFKKKADFGEARFEAIAAFGESELNSPVFESSTFGGNVWFTAAKLFGAANFRNVAFRDHVDFSHSAFFGSADFSFANFDRSDFSETIFEAANFAFTEFSKTADFQRLVVRGRAVFHSTKFQGVRFESAHFHGGASFDSATFSGDVEFKRATFGLLPDANGSTDGAEAVADFSDAKFEEPTRVWFSQVNKDVGVGLRARFLNCDVEQVHLEDVRWHRRGGRMVLQDELDLIERTATEATPGAKTADNRSGHELVAIAYRQLINNFDKVRALDLAEDCFCGAMEMKRRDPDASWLSRAVLTAYKLASSYGSNYVRAFFVLLAIVVVFGMVFAAPWVGLEAAKGNPGGVLMASSWLRRLPAGAFHSLEVGSFQREPVYVLPSRRGRLVVTAEQVLIPIQAALLLLALRRRFRR